MTTKTDSPLTRLGQYLTAIGTNGVPEQYATNTCPECGAHAYPFGGALTDEHGHFFADSRDLIIGCEGYWIVRPSSVGLADGMWSDWTDGE